jgi:hypothetical protein
MLPEMAHIKIVCVFRYDMGEVENGLNDFNKFKRLEAFS